MKHLLIILSFFLLSSLLTSCEKKEVILYSKRGTEVVGKNIWSKEGCNRIRNNYSFDFFYTFNSPINPIFDFDVFKTNNSDDDKDKLYLKCQVSFIYRGQIKKKFILFGEELPHGQGTRTARNGSKYVGEWKSNKYHGQGTEIWRDGTKYVGGWKDGRPHGQGTYTYPKDTLLWNGTLRGGNGTKFVGEWKDGTLNGTYTDGEGNIFGEIVNGDRYVNGKSIEKPYKARRQ
jgi:hypothetical protein